MMRGTSLKLVNDSIHEYGPIDTILKKLGGTVYTNCYTPAPDSPRSIACLYTGLYPKKNGCKKRIQWPKFYLDENSVTLFSLLIDNGYALFDNFRPVDIKVGIFPNGIEKISRNCDGIIGLTDNVNKNADCNNLFAFLSLSDYHIAVNNRGPDFNSNIDGQIHISNAIKLFFDKIYPEFFDYIVIFSDHGCEFKEDAINDDIYKTCDPRTKILMFIHKKGDTKIKKCSSLTSILDVFPTLEEIIVGKIIHASDGVSLFKPIENRYIVIEDHSKFYPSIDCPHDLWAVRTETFFYLESLTKISLLKIQPNHTYVKVKNIEKSYLDKFQKLLDTNSCSYTENKRQIEILKFYDELNKEELDQKEYSDGQKIKKSLKTKIWNLVRKVR